jgi:anti-sigma regulatory factor (Ser/Thr protein kinase)
MQVRHKIAGGDFAKAGNIASSVKKILKQLNIDHSISKKIVIALYEGEVNVVAHAYSGVTEVEIDEEKIKITITDKGPGIEDIEQAMQEGFSTASPQVREMGFGAGMGLANMKKNSDSMKISSTPGEGTIVELITYIKPDAR